MRGQSQNKMANRILVTMTRPKLAAVSYKVAPMWPKMLLSATMFRKQEKIPEGELKIKESMSPVPAENSHRARNARIRKIRAKWMRNRCLF